MHKRKHKTSSTMYQLSKFFNEQEARNKTSEPRKFDMVKHLLRSVKCYARKRISLCRNPAQVKIQFPRILIVIACLAKNRNFKSHEGIEHTDIIGPNVYVTRRDGNRKLFEQASDLFSACFACLQSSDLK